MKCPVCGAELVKVPNNPKRMRCNSCRRVFDTGQLERLYGVKSGDKNHSLVLPYETQHMHEKHRQTGNAGSRHTQGNTVNKNTTFIDDSLPGQTMSSNMAGQTQSYGQAGSGGRKKNTSSATKIIVIICILFFFVPFLITTCTAFIDWLEESESLLYTDSNTNVFYGQGSNTYVAGSSHSELETVSPEFILDTCHDDYYGDVLIVRVNWENNTDYKYDLSAFRVFEVAAENSQSEPLRSAYIGDVDGKFDSDSKFDEIGRGKKGTADWAFATDGAQEIRIAVVASNDAYDYSDPPMIVITAEVKDGKAEITNIFNPFSKTGDAG